MDSVANRVLAANTKPIRMITGQLVEKSPEHRFCLILRMLGNHFERASQRDTGRDRPTLDFFNKQ
jgi:hypothetical protein